MAHPGTSSREITIDLLRGLALMMIVVDHMSGSVLAQLTLRNFSIGDAAELFVFLSGYATAVAWLRLTRHGDLSRARGRFLRRAAEIYLAFLLTAAMMLLGGLWLGGIGLQTPAVAGSEAPDFIAEPAAVAWQVLTLQRQPYLSDILPMYVLFALCTPWLLPLAAAWPARVLAGSVALWLAAPALSAWLPGVSAHGWNFNPFAWQLLFVLGLSCKLHPGALHGLSAVARRRWTWAAAAFAIVGAFFAALLWRSAELHQALVPAWFEDLFYPIGKQHLDAARVLGFLAIAWLAYRARDRLHALARSLPGLQRVGRYGMLCFVAGCAISILGEALSHAASAGGPPPWHTAVLADVLAVSAMLLVARLAEATGGPRRAPAVVQPPGRVA